MGQTTQWGRFLFFCLVLAYGCRTAVRPPSRPVANLFPTLYRSTVLAETRPGDVSVPSLAGFLNKAGLLVPLRAAGMRQDELATVVRGLAHRGYAEIDARRCVCSVNWVVFRVVSGERRSVLVLEAGMNDATNAARAFGISMSRTPIEGERQDVYGRRFKLRTWSTRKDGALASVRRVSSLAGRAVHWELEVSMPLPPDENSARATRRYKDGARPN